MDPFYTETQVAHFKSKTFYDNEIFTANDTMICSIVQSTMAMKRDNYYKSYIWTQFPQSIVKSKLLDISKNELVDSDGSDCGGIEDDEKDIIGRVMFE